MDLLDRIIPADLYDRVELIYTHDLVPIIAISVATLAFACWRDYQSSKETAKTITTTSNAAVKKSSRPGKSWRVQEHVLRHRRASLNEEGIKTADTVAHTGIEPQQHVSVLLDRAMHLFGEVGMEWEDGTKTKAIPPAPVTAPTTTAPSVELEREEYDVALEEESRDDGSGEEVLKDPQPEERSPSNRELQDDQEKPETIEGADEEGRGERKFLQYTVIFYQKLRSYPLTSFSLTREKELVIDTEIGLFQSARPRVSAYVDEGREHLRRAGSWFGLPEPHSPLNVLRKASRLEWALFMGLRDVTKSGVASFADDFAERVKPSRHADLGRRVAFAHLDSLDWEEVLRANAYRMDEREYSSLEDSVMAFLGFHGPTKFPLRHVRFHVALQDMRLADILISYRPATKQRTWPTPRDKFAEGKTPTLELDVYADRRRH
ncbi:hypothetical protein G7054_g3393 [Neopestalotiopsis clavispora]|nr:hypothetical protein G7054_g3393 [Neopestalotiopsis clavispora]